MIKTIIVDDHEFFRKTLRDYLKGIDIVDVIGEAGDGLEAVELAKRLMPQLVLMDIKMPKLDGMAACKIIKEAMPDTKTILYTMYNPEMYCQERATSADRCMSKDRLFDEIPGIISKLSGR